MAKERLYQKKRKRMIKIISLVVIILFIFGLIFYFNVNNLPSEETLENFVATGSIPFHTDFFSIANTLNPQVGFTFVSLSTGNVYLYKKLHESTKIYQYNPGTSTVAGLQCETGDLVRFVYCDSSTDKNTCRSDIFGSLWQVHTKDDYLNFAEFKQGQNSFKYSYSCYETSASWDESKRNFLVEDKCTHYAEAYGSDYVRYTTENDCIEALKNLNTPDDIILDNTDSSNTDSSTVTDSDTSDVNSCLYKTYDNFACKGDKVYQQTRNALCEISFSKYTYTCDNGCTAGVCNAPTVTTPNVFTNPFTQTTQENPSTSSNNTVNNNVSTQVIETETDETISCKAYEELGEDNECKFSFMNVFSTTGFVEFWEDMPYVIIIIGLLLAGLVYLVIPSQGGKKKK